MKRNFFILLLFLFGLTEASLGQCLKAGKGAVYGTSITRTSGNSQNDKVISDFVRRINSVFGTSSQFYFYDDSKASNAYASSEDRNIYIGVNFLSETLNSNTGITGVAFLIGHELAHIYQFKTKYSNKFMSEEGSKNCELQADFLSAYVMGKLGLVTTSNYGQMLSQTMEVGDVFFKEQDHHGSPSERKNSATSGFSFRQLPFSNVYSKSYTYCCPQATDKNRIAYTLNIYNGLTYYVVYGGALCIKDKNGEFQKIAQMASTNNYPITYTFEFSKKDPTKNLYMDVNYRLVDYSGNVVGTIIRHDPQTTASPSKPSSSGHSSEEIQTEEPKTKEGTIYKPRFNFKYKPDKEYDLELTLCENGFKVCFYCADGYNYCNNCKATGQCPDDHYSAKGSGFCRICGGTGCNKCGGTGQCTSCNGNGRCKICDGKGRKVCLECKGTNKLACK